MSEVHNEPTESSPVLATRDLAVGYGRIRLLSGIDIEVRAGEAVALVGRNGVGKTTFMKTLMGLLKPQTGSITYMGEDVTRRSAASRAHLGIGYVPQHRGIFKGLNVYENLRIGEKIGRTGGADNLDKVYSFFPRLKERRNQKAGSLSGGEQQQLSFGRIMVGDPRLILLDEPTEGLQPSLIDELGDTIKQLHEEENVTIVLVEQNLNLIQTVAERAAVIEKGVIAKWLTREEVSDTEKLQGYLAL